MIIRRPRQRKPPPTNSVCKPHPGCAPARFGAPSTDWVPGLSPARSARKQVPACFITSAMHAYLGVLGSL